MYSNVYKNDFVAIRELIDMCEFEKAHDALKSITDKCSEWYYLNSQASMNLGYYEEGEKSILKASTINPENTEYKKALESYNFYRDRYREESYGYNRRKRRGMDCDCCCCCDDCCCCGCDDCGEDCMRLWCLDSVCECMGGDLVDCC